MPDGQEAMNRPSAAEIRRRYLQWFVERGHAHLPSDSLVPSHDPTLLFTGAGMNQFKDMFLGKGDIPHRRVTTVQKCLRVPDLEKVGLTPRHHTFFEMLGNFSFGDYFKEDCLRWILGFFTEACGLPRDRLVATIYTKDDEAYRVWTEVCGFPPERIYRFGEKENFWPAEAPSKGPNGPCGPCSEIYYDYEPERPLPPNEGLEALPDRFVEIGNCVFTQFDRREDGSLPPLPQRNIDVGLGLERIAAVVQGVETNFDTELFLPLIECLSGLSDRKYRERDEDDVRMRRIADHVRALGFCIADGILPGNEGRGYVVRKILRRACRDGWQLGIGTPFLHRVAEVLIDGMGDYWTELRDGRGQILAVLEQEEASFHQVYEQGIGRFHKWASELGDPGDWTRVAVEDRGELPVPPDSGRFAFELHDTHGFPRDITEQLLLDLGFALDAEGFDRAMAAQRERARSGSKLAGEVFTESFATRLKERDAPKTHFSGYEKDEDEGRLLGIAIGDLEVEELREGHEEGAVLVFDRSPFYAESGGQVGDRGRIEGPSGEARVLTTRKLEGFHLHEVRVLKGGFRAGEHCRLTIDAEARRATERNHTATHLLHQALKEVLGPHVSQAGSLVAPDRLRFDFTHNEKIPREVLDRIEDRVNSEIMAALEVRPVEMELAEARAAGFVALFGEKYGARVRTLSVGDYSRELCGGTHVRNSGNIGPFRILHETSVAAGIRRIEAVSGEGALRVYREALAALEDLARDLKTPPSGVRERVSALLAEGRRLRRELEALRRGGVGEKAAELETEIERGEDGSNLVACVPGADHDELLDLMDRFRKKFPDFAGLLFGLGDSGVALVAAGTKERVARGFHAGNLLREVAKAMGGGGGGRPELARGRAKAEDGLEDGLKTARRLLGPAKD